MKETKEIKIARLFNNLAALGFNCNESYQLRRIEMTLQRWAENECGNSNDYCSRSIERDETTGKPFMVYHPHSGGKARRAAIPDREKGALARLAKIMANHPALWFYHQSDPRGCALYVGKLDDVKGQCVGQVYNRGLAVCI